MSVLEMRQLADSFAPVINGNLPEVGAFHEAVPVGEGVTADVVVGGADPLTVQSAALATALAAAGVAHEYCVDAGMPHGYVQMEYLGGEGLAIERMVAFLRRTV